LPFTIVARDLADQVLVGVEHIPRDNQRVSLFYIRESQSTQNGVARGGGIDPGILRFTEAVGASVRPVDDVTQSMRRLVEVIRGSQWQIQQQRNPGLFVL
jgi:hypothetical protein